MGTSLLGADSRANGRVSRETKGSLFDINNTPSPAKVNKR